MSAIPSPVSLPGKAAPFFGSLRGPRRARLGFTGLLVFTLPLVALLFFTVFSAIGDYRRTIQFDDFWGHAANIEKSFTARLRAAVNLPGALMVEHGFDPEHADPTMVRLLIPGNEWEQIFADPQAGWGEWFEAELENGTSLSKAKVRKRGDNSIHWSTPKKSFTLRTQLDATFNGYRTLALSVKDVLPSFVANRMAEQAGLFTPHTEISPVFLNNRFYGLFRMIEAIDESFLRKFERLPGNVFRGETAERGEAFKNQPRNLFQNPYIWDLAARNSRAASSGDAGLRALIAGVNSTRLEGHQAMMAVLYREEIARMIALMLVVGDPYHMDEVHNQFWYEDPWSGYLHPVAWDLRLLRLDRPPMQLNSFLRAAIRDPLVLDLVLENLQEMVKVNPVLPRVDSLVRAVYTKNERYFEYEYDRAGIIPDVGTPQEVMEIIRSNTALLTRWLEDSRVGFQSTARPGGTQVIDWETRGIAGARWTGATLEGVSGTPAVYADKNLNGQLDGQDSLIRISAERVGSGVRIKFSEPIVLTPGWNTRSKGISAGHQHYRFFVTGVQGAITPLVFHRFTDTDATVERIAPDAILVPPDGWHPWQLVPPAGRTHRLSGVVRLSQSLFVSDRDTLDISPGTNLKLDPEVSVVVYGHLQARGTAAQPIIVEPAVEGRPWGTLALQGHGANGSRIAHLRARGGGGAVIGEVEYTGAVSIQYARDVKADYLEVIDNTRSDDAFHAYHATVDLSHCYFRNTIGDAIDYDFADGVISDCRFEGAGNDGIDLMTSNPTIVNNQIYNGGDKGISIGEDSHPLVFNNLISGNVRGIEVKDHSEPVILNNVITGNRVGIRERRKNPRYGAGGWAKVVNTLIQGNRRDIERDEFSRLTLVGSTLGTDTVAAITSAPVDVGWLYRRYGIQPDRIAADTVGWQQVPAVMPDTAGFREDFLSVSDGWTATGGVERLEKRRDNLILEMHNVEAVITRRIDWNVTRPSVAVFEVAGRDLESASVVIGSESDEIEAPIKPDADFTRFQLITIDLPPGHYTSLRIRATAIPGLERLARTTTLLERQNGRLELHRYGRYERPQGSPSGTDIGPK